MWVMEGLETGAFEEAVDAGGIRIIDGGGCEDLFEVLDGFGEGLDGSGEGGSAGVGVASALELFCDGEGFAVPATEADEEITGSFAVEVQQDGVGAIGFVEEVMDDEVGVADGSFDDADIAWERGDMLAAPIEAEGVFYFAFELGDLEQGVVEQFFGFTVDESVEVPEAVCFDEAGVVDGGEEGWVIDEEQI